MTSLAVASSATPGDGARAMAGETIIVVDDDTGLRGLICEYLAAQGYAVHPAESVAALRSLMDRVRPEVIIMDVMMPQEDGLDGMRWLRSRSDAACIMLSTLAADIDRIVGLELGADDYIAKPCNPRELLARVRAVMRRRPLVRTGAAEGGEPGWVFDTRHWRLIAPDGQQPELSTHDIRLLQALVEAEGRVLSRDRLMEVLDPDAESFDRSIDVQVSRLRRRLADHGGQALIRTVRGFGYGLGLPVRRV
ncbi:response regulator transcription factor [Blastomonas natatoria]|nr:response regulator transcription factor [Blastomonas natatoria]